MVNPLWVENWCGVISLEGRCCRRWCSRVPELPSVARQSRLEWQPLPAASARMSSGSHYIFFADATSCCACNQSVSTVPFQCKSGVRRSQNGQARASKRDALVHAAWSASLDAGACCSHPALRLTRWVMARDRPECQDSLGISVAARSGWGSMGIGSCYLSFAGAVLWPTNLCSACLSSEGASWHVVRPEWPLLEKTFGTAKSGFRVNQNIF